MGETMNYYRVHIHAANEHGALLRMYYVVNAVDLSIAESNAINTAISAGFVEPSVVYSQEILETGVYLAGIREIGT